MPDLTWIDDQRAQIGDVEFVCSFPSTVTPRPDLFPVLKARSDVEHYVRLLADLKPRTILEVGGWSGGSAAMIWLLAEPDRMAVVDLADDPAPALDAFVEANDLGDHFHRYWSTDQSDVEALAAVMTRTFSDAPLDLIIDDASHLLEPTRVTFDRTFPRLRPGGVFVLEDWAHDHSLEAAILSAIAEDPTLLARLEQRVAESGAEAAPDPLSILVVELLLAAACRPDIISNIEVNHAWVVLTRGDADLDVGTFSLGDCIGRRGAQMVRALEGLVPENADESG